MSSESDDAASTAITTFLRIRPTSKKSGYFTPAEQDDEKASTALINVAVPSSDAKGLVNNTKTSWRFAFNGVLNENISQEEVYDRVGAPVVASVTQGFNGTIFAYGQTGSGKTYTLTGGVGAYAERGIIPRAISAVFAHASASADDAEYTVRISYLEIYNEVGYDLLGDRASKSSGGGQEPALQRTQGVVEEADGSVWVRGLSSHVAATEEARNLTRRCCVASLARAHVQRCRYRRRSTCSSWATPTAPCPRPR